MSGPASPPSEPTVPPPHWSPPAAAAVPPPPPAPPGFPVQAARAPRLDPASVRPALLLAGVIAAIFFGSQILNAVVPAASGGAGPQAGATLDVGQLRIQIARGWQSLDGPVGPRIAKGSVAIDIGTIAFSDDVRTLYDDFVADALAPHAIGFGATAASLVEVGNGLPAARGAYTGVFGEGGEIEGQLTALVVAGQGYVFDAWGQAGSLNPLLPEVELMLDTLQVVE